MNRIWALLFGRPLAEPVDDLARVASTIRHWVAARRRFRRTRLQPPPSDTAPTSCHPGLFDSTVAVADTPWCRTGGSLAGVPAHPPAAWFRLPGHSFNVPRSRPSVPQSHLVHPVRPPTPWLHQISSAATATLAKTNSTHTAARSSQRLVLMNGDVVRDKNQKRPLHRLRAGSPICLPTTVLAA